MNILVSAPNGQGKRSNDFNHTTTGELLAFVGFECDGEDIDGACGCRRSFSGLTSHKATTTALVIDMPGMTKTDLYEKLWDSMVEAGWIKHIMTSEARAEADAQVKTLVDELVEIASSFKPGDVLEKRGDELITRGFVPSIRALYEQATPVEKGKSNARKNAGTTGPKRKTDKPKPRRARQAAKSG